MGSRPERIWQQASPTVTLNRLSRAVIATVVSRNAFANGERYWQQGRVSALDIRDDGALITARIRGSEPKPYRVTITTLAIGDNLLIEGACSCPVGDDCKHVAAALFAMLATRSKHPTIPRGAQHQAADRATAELFPNLAPSHAPSAPPLETLTPAIATWIDSLARLEQTETEDYPDELRQRLIYVLNLSRSKTGVPELAVEPTSARLLKTGAFSDQTTVVNLWSIGSHPPKYLRPSDRDILKQLSPLGSSLTGEAGVVALKAMIATGRARWRSLDGPVVTEGPARDGRIAWRLADDGSHQPALELDPGAIAVRTTPPWYVVPDTGLMGPIETGFAPRIAAGILSAPPVPPGQIDLLRHAMRHRLPKLAIIEPPELEALQRIDSPPVPGLRLMAITLPRNPYYYYGSNAGAEPEQVLLARPFFRYEGLEIGADDNRPRPIFARGGRIVEIARNGGAERKALRRLADRGFKRLSVTRPHIAPADHKSDLALADSEAWLDLLYRDVPALRADGWIIETDPDFPLDLVRADGEFLAELREGSGIDWFELDLGVVMDGERLDLVPALLAAMAKPTYNAQAVANVSESNDLPFYLPLADGRILALPVARIKPILVTLYELFSATAFDADARRLTFSRHDASIVADFEAATHQAGIVWRGGEQLRELGRMLREAGRIPNAVLPASFAATLRPYQARGVDWLQFLRSANLGGVLADDMGLGKTVQLLAHLAIEKASGRLDRPALVIAPTSVVPNWRREAARFAPDLKVLTLQGLDRKSRFGEIAAHDVVLTSYPLLARDHETLKAQPWHVVVLDEAQTIKNPDAITTRLVGQIEARHRLCLTGTPLENNLGEVWSLFAFLLPGFLGDRTAFRRQWRTPIEKKGDTERRRMLARRIRPFLLRRTKAEVITELPPKTEIVEPIEMEAPQRDLYDSIRLAMHAKVRAAIAEKGLARSQIVVLDALLKLRQTCCDPRLLKIQAAAAAKARSAKLDRLMDMLPQLIEEGRRILLFSQFTSMLALIQQALGAADIRYVLLTGDTRDRETPIRQFQDGAVPLFLISLKAGGLGLNLTAADTVIHYDPWWNPAVEDQATDRAHRIGQTKSVFVHKLVMLASIEEKMESLKQRKRDLAAGLFDPDAGSPLDLTEADIDDLFAPM
jgi:superfamily II DNA or RNA helicase